MLMHLLSFKQKFYLFNASFTKIDLIFCMVTLITTSAVRIFEEDRMNHTKLIKITLKEKILSKNIDSETFKKILILVNFLGTPVVFQIWTSFIG